MAAICKNCNTPLQGDYCHQCGQKATVKRLSLKEMVRNLVSSALNFHASLPQTFLKLWTQPGKTTRAYLAGRRRAFTNPIRYLFLTTTISFLLMRWFNVFDEQAMLELGQQMGQGISSGLVEDDTVSQRGVMPTDSLVLERPAIPVQDSAAAEAMRKLERFQTPEFQQEFNRSLLNNMTLLTFSMIPFLGLAMYLFFYRREFNYGEHLAAMSYQQGQSNWISVAVIPFAVLFELGAWTNLITTVLSLVYMVYFYYRFLQLRSFWSVFRLGFAWLLGFLSWFIVTMAITSIGLAIWAFF